MPKVSEAHREGRREQIIAAAWQCFSRKGIHATSMEDLIQEAGLSAGAVYTYFKGKEQLILSAVSSSLVSVGKLLGRVLENKERLTPDELIHELLRVMAQFASRKDLNFNSVIIMCWSEVQTNPQLKALIRPFHADYPKLLTETVIAWQKSNVLDPAINPGEIARAIIAYLYGFIVQSALMGDSNPELFTRGLKGLLSGGVVRRPKR